MSPEQGMAMFQMYNNAYEFLKDPANKQDDSLDPSPPFYFYFLILHLYVCSMPVYMLHRPKSHYLSYLFTRMCRPLGFRYSLRKRVRR